MAAYEIGEKDDLFVYWFNGKAISKYNRYNGRLNSKK